MDNRVYLRYNCIQVLFSLQNKSTKDDHNYIFVNFDNLNTYILQLYDVIYSTQHDYHTLIYTVF